MQTLRQLAAGQVARQVARGSVRTGAYAVTRRRGAGQLSKEQRKAVRRMLSADKELFHINNEGTIDATSTVSFTQLTTIAQGDGYNERLGDEVDLSGIKARLLAVRDDNATNDTYDNLRIIFFIWHPDTANETPGAVTDILESATTPYLSPLILDKSVRNKFTLVHDSWVTNCTRENGDSARAFNKIFISEQLKKNIYFNPGVTTGRNHLYMMVLGEQAAGSNNSSVYYNIRVTYRQK